MCDKWRKSSSEERSALLAEQANQELEALLALDLLRDVDTKCVREKYSKDINNVWEGICEKLGGSDYALGYNVAGQVDRIVHDCWKPR